MRICMVFYDMQDFGGLEEYAVTLAITLQKQGHEISMLSSAWISEKNQYLQRLRENGITLVQLPKWISLIASDWATKEKILRFTVMLFSPLTFLLGLGVCIVKRRSLKIAINSAYNWLRGRLMKGMIGPDRRKPLTCIILNWWKIYWNPDLLHIHGYTTKYTSNLLFVIDWAYKKQIPIVYEEHQTPHSQFVWWKDFEKYINKADVVVAVSEKSAQALKTVCDVTRPIMINGPIVPDPETFGWRKEEKTTSRNTSLCVVTFARLYAAKGLEYFIETIPRVREIHPSTRFLVYGEGDLRQELLKYAEELGLDGEKIFVGAFKDRRELFRIMSETDIFLMSSVLEGQPVALVEAMAYSRAIVATAVGGIGELIQDGINGMLCPPRDPDCLARKLIMLIDNPGLRHNLGMKARRSYEQGPFQPASAAQHFVTIYKKALRNHLIR